MKEKSKEKPQKLEELRQPRPKARDKWQARLDAYKKKKSAGGW